jgi:light-regulated signal transduction histidine kinase (bacteriophytochrome)
MARVRNRNIPILSRHREILHTDFISALPDSILLDLDFNVVAISQNILDLLELSLDEVQHRQVNRLATTDLMVMLKVEMFVGYVSERPVVLTGKSGKRHNVLVTGFNMGLVSELTEYIILKVIHPDTPSNSQSRETLREVDQFIYRTAHDVRGPLATMKGLINLIKLRKDNEDLDHLVMLLEAHANLLDERLFQLLYVSQSDHVLGSPNRFVDFQGVETSLRKIIEQNAFVDFLDFRFSAPVSERIEVDGSLLTGIFDNLLLYVLSLPMTSAEVGVNFRIQSQPQTLAIVITTKGFESSPFLQTAVRESPSLYGNLMQHPQLMNFYAARKIALQLRAAINVQFEGTDTQHIMISVPLGKSSFTK